MLCLAAAALVLSACSGQTPQTGNNPAVYAEATQYLGPVVATDTPAPAQPTADNAASDPSIFSANPYDVPQDYTANDALGEEDATDNGVFIDTGAGALTAVQAESTVYVYAGATPIPLLPVDMPSPTPRAELAFSYVSYTAGSLGLTFDAPTGWTTDDSQTDIYTITEPESQMHDGQQCVVTISAVPVNNNYSEAELKKQVTQRLKDIGAVNFVVWQPSLTATRHLMGSKGVYANYSGELADGTALGGRIHYVCVENKLYGVEIVYPREYKNDYLNVFSKIRETIKRI